MVPNRHREKWQQLDLPELSIWLLQLLVEYNLSQSHFLSFYTSFVPMPRHNSVTSGLPARVDS
jgi:hypothetical protein